jgi:hypothetical protein
MRRIKLIATAAMSALAFACSTAPAYADEVHPWCGTLVGIVHLVVAQPEDILEINALIIDAEGGTWAQKLEALEAAQFAVALSQRDDLSDEVINTVLTAAYNACLKEHA